MQWLEYVNLNSVLIVFLIFVPLEHLIPHDHDKPFVRKHFFNDLFYLLFNGILIKFGMLAVVGTALLVVWVIVPDWVREAVSSQPIWLQVIETIIVADIGFYLAHRAFHTFPFLWRFHAIHHSIEEMDTLAAHRVHPVDQILTKSASYVPIFALGFSPAAVAIYALIYQWQSLLIHSNIKIPFGPFKWLVASPHFHHWHHANEKQAYDKNFAGQLPFIDALLGTLYMPKSYPEKYGVDEKIPELYHQQLAYPFIPPKPEGATDVEANIGKASREQA